jgi:anti-sigma factor RsiW
VHCARVREKLTEYQLGLLEGAKAAELRVHIEQCPECREELAAFERLDAMMEPAEQHEAPDDMWLGIQARMKPRRASWWQTWRESPKPTLALAAAMLLAVGGIWMGLRGGPAEMRSYDVLASDYQEQQIVAQWSQPLADDAALGLMYANLETEGEAQ